MKRNMKIFSAALALVLVFGAVVGGTIAWLMDQTQIVTNVFTMGDVAITLTETANQGATYDDDNNLITNPYDMVPGATIAKDPKVTVAADSEACWVFVKIDAANNTFGNDQEVISYVIDTGWTQLTDAGDNEIAGVYYREVTPNGNEDTVLNVLKDNQVTVNSAVTKDIMQQIARDQALKPQLAITAYAIQQDNITGGAIAAWNAVSNQD